MKATTKYMLILLLLVVSIPATTATADEKEMMPSEALEELQQWMNQQDRSAEDYGQKQSTLAREYLEKVKKEGLDRENEMALGDLYFYGFMPNEAAEIYEKHKHGDDLLARHAWNFLFQINFRAFEKYDQVESDIQAFRTKFNPVPDDLTYTMTGVQNMASYYKSQGNHEKVVELVEAELSALPNDWPYVSLILPALHMDSYEAVGKGDMAVEHINKTLESLKPKLGSDELPEAAQGRAQRIVGMLEQTLASKS